MDIYENTNDLHYYDLRHYINKISYDIKDKAIYIQDLDRKTTKQIKKIKKQIRDLEKQIIDLENSKNNVSNEMIVQQEKLIDLQRYLYRKEELFNQFNILDTIKKYEYVGYHYPEDLSKIDKSSLKYLKAIQNFNLLQNLFIYIIQESNSGKNEEKYQGLIEIMNLFYHLYMVYVWKPYYPPTILDILTEILELLYILKPVIIVKFEKNIDKTKIEEALNTIINNHIDIIKSCNYTDKHRFIDPIPEVDEIINSIIPNTSTPPTTTPKRRTADIF